MGSVQSMLERTGADEWLVDVVLGPEVVKVESVINGYVCLYINLQALIPIKSTKKPIKRHIQSRKRSLCHLVYFMSFYNLLVVKPLFAWVLFLVRIRFSAIKIGRSSSLI